MKHRFTFLMAFFLMASTAFAQLVDVVTGLTFPYGLAINGNDLYISQNSAYKISKIDISLPNPPIVEVVTVSAPLALFLDGDELYFGAEFYIKKINITQPNPVSTTLVSGLGQPRGMLRIGNTLYVLDFYDGLFSLDLNQPNPTLVPLVSGFFGSDAITSKDSILYITEFSEDRVSTVDLKQSPLVRNTLVTGLSFPSGITRNGNFLYVTGGSEVYKIDINQPNPSAEVVTTGLLNARQVAFDGIDMYIAQVGDGGPTDGKISKLQIGQPSFSFLGSVCSNTMPNDLGGASPTGGTYSGPGVTNNGNGETFTFNPAAAGGAGTYTITYTATNGNTATTTLTVAEAPVVSVSTDGSIQLDFGTVPILDGSPAGGTYSGPGVLPGNLFDPYLAGVGIFTITYTYTAANGCSGSDSFIVTVMPGANDACDGATSIDNLLGGALNVPQVSTEFNNTGYTTAGDPTTGYDCFVDPGGSSLEHTLWYTFLGDGSKYRIRSVNCNNATPYNDDTQVAIYAGACNSLSPVACNDDENAAAYNISVEVATQAGTAYRMLVDGFDGKEGRFCLEVTNLMPSAATEIGQTDIGVFPNPTTGVVQLTNVKADQVQVFDNMSRLVFTKAQPGNSIDISGVPAGMYFLKITEGEAVYSARVVKE